MKSMNTLFDNCSIDLEQGIVKSKKGDYHKKNANGYHCCKLNDSYGNKYYYIHEVIIAEGLQLPKHLWPLDENGKRYVVDHITPVSNGGTDAFENLRLIPEADNHKTPLTRKNNSQSKIGKHPINEWKSGHTPWNKGKKYHTNKHWKHSEETKQKLSKSSIGNSNASKEIYQYSIDGEFIRKWSSASEAARECGYNQYNISACCSGKRKQSNGYKWFREPL